MRSNVNYRIVKTNNSAWSDSTYYRLVT